MGKDRDVSATTLRPKKSVEDIWPMYGKRVAVRVDFNVPIKGGIIRNDYRIRSALPTIKRILDQGGICILMSHLGRPKGVHYTAHQQNSRHQRVLEIWVSERGTGKTAFFAQLEDKIKAEILSLCNQSILSPEQQDQLDMTLKHGKGKTSFFATLLESEKKRLLDCYDSMYAKEKHMGATKSSFPLLRQYHGYEEELSLHPVVGHLSELLGCPVHWAPDCMEAHELIKACQPGDVVLLENVRFYKEESSKDEKERDCMAHRLSQYCDYFVSDAFGTAHRESATMTNLPRVLGHGAAGYLMQREVNYFAKVLSAPPRPQLAIVGGAKVSDKILLLEFLIPQIDELIIGGAMAYAFLKAQGHGIGKSFCEKGQSYVDTYSGTSIDLDHLTLRLLEKAKAHGVTVHLPLDHVCHTECSATDRPLLTETVDVPDSYMALDIGARTQQSWSEVIRRSKCVVWNGPVGVFEIETYAHGTFALATCIAEQTKQGLLLSIVGGGDTASAVDMCGVTAQISHVSTGGGATLELLEGKVLPGVRVLDDK